MNRKMVETSCFPDTHQPVRSISLPSRLHPPSVKLEAALNRLCPWRTSASSVSVTFPVNAEALHVGLLNLSELYNCVHELLQSPQIQFALLHHQSGKLVKDASDISVSLLDTSDMTRNVLLRMKDCLQNLQSDFRQRGKSKDSILGNSLQAYNDFRKKTKREIEKSLQELKKTQRKASEFRALICESYDLSKMVDVIREAITITISIFRSLLLFLSVPNTKSKIGFGGLLSASKLIPFLSSSSWKKRGNMGNLINEVLSLDLVLFSFQDCRSNVGSDTKIGVPILQKTLENVDERIRVLEAGLGIVFKCLILNRASFLNIISSRC